MIIAIEGVDGSGKNTQARLLTEFLNTATYHQAVMHSFPKYSDSFFGREVGKYLNGEYGSMKEVMPKVAAMLYAGDRFEASKVIRSQLLNDNVLVMDRYVQSNLIHQGAKVNGKDRIELIEWIEWLEYKVYELPKPDVTIFLQVEPKYSDKLVEAKDARNYTDKKKDLHEADINHILKAFNVARELAQKQGWYTIQCTNKDGILPIQEIHEEIVNVLLSTKMI